MVSKRFILPLLALWATAFALPSSGAVQVSIDRDPVAYNESFQLRFELDFELSGRPDFSALERDFEILAHNQQTTVNMLNRKIERRQIHTLELMAKRSGSVTIPAIDFGGQSSRPIIVTVQEVAADAQAPDYAYVEVELSEQQTYPQAQIVYTVKLYRATRFASASLSEPRLPGADAIIEKLGEDSSYDTVRDGRRFVVTERRYAVFPQRPGRFQFEPISFQGQVAQGSRSLLFDYGARGRLLRIQSQAPTLIVEPVPAEAQGLPWLPANSVTLSEEWSHDPDSVPAGEPVTRSIILTAQGQTAVQLPALTTAVPDSVKAYPDQAQLNDKPQRDGITAVRQEKVALVPGTPGLYELPAVKLPWWDVENRTLKYAELPARTIKVVGPTGGTGPLTGAELAAAETALPEEVSSAETPAAQQSANPWPWISLGLLLGWTLSLALIWRQRNRQKDAAPVSEDRQQSRSKLEKQLSAACRANNAQQAEALLLRIAELTWPEQPPRALHNVARYSSEPLRDELLELEQHRYGPHADSWSGDKFWATYRKAPLKSSEAKASRENTCLEPLYPKA